MEKKKMKLWKKILIVVLIVFAILTARKMVIIKKLQDKVSKYASIDNYHVAKYQYNDKNLTIFDTYKKAEKTLLTIKILSKDKGTRNMTRYEDEKVNHLYIESNGDKVAVLNSNGVPSAIKITSIVDTNDMGQLIFMSIFSSIKTEECNGKQCYKIDIGYAPNVLFEADQRMTAYLDKETGLEVRLASGTNTIIDCTYEFNTVTDEDLKEPDLSEYRIQENSKNN